MSIITVMASVGGRALVHEARSGEEVTARRNDSLTGSVSKYAIRGCAVGIRVAVFRP